MSFMIRWGGCGARAREAELQGDNFTKLQSFNDGSLQAETRSACVFAQNQPKKPH